MCADLETEVEVVTGRRREAGSGDGRWHTEVSEEETRIAHAEAELLEKLDGVDVAVQSALAVQRASAAAKVSGKRRPVLPVESG